MKTAKMDGAIITIKMRAVSYWPLQLDPNPIFQLGNRLSPPYSRKGVAQQTGMLVVEYLPAGAAWSPGIREIQHFACVIAFYLVKANQAADVEKYRNVLIR
jgi:DNA integrity scanning protein DisA with diadenylate cyclase activity